MFDSIEARFAGWSEGEGAGASGGVIPVVPRVVSLLDDQLTPVVAYRRLVAPDERTAASFLFESVHRGSVQSRYSILGAQPRYRLVAKEQEVELTELSREGVVVGRQRRSVRDPLGLARAVACHLRTERGHGLASADAPGVFLGGWVGSIGYDTVRYAEPEKLAFAGAPVDDRGLDDMDIAFYDRIVVFDHARKLVHAVRLVGLEAGVSEGELLGRAGADLADLVERLATHSEPMRSGVYDAGLARRGAEAMESNITRGGHAGMVARAQEYIRAGDIFQVVVGQRFVRRSVVDPYDVYRSLRAVNPSPYMVYLQCGKCILIASSPEILCRVRRVDGGGDGALEVTNRPLAGTRPRGGSEERDRELESELLSDPKEVAEHVMLVDLGRNDVGRVARVGSVELARRLEVERYSHVMHISSTVTGRLASGLSVWDALRAALPVGTISGAPKIRAMQIIDELEPVRRGPYGGGLGYIGLEDDMDIALALRTMVVMREGDAWRYDLQAAGGIVLDSRAEAEFQETVNKAGALARAIDVAEGVFTDAEPGR